MDLDCHLLKRCSKQNFLNHQLKETILFETMNEYICCTVVVSLVFQQQERSLNLMKRSIESLGAIALVLNNQLFKDIENSKETFYYIFALNVCQRYNLKLRCMCLQ